LSQQEHYYSIQGPATAEFKDRGSRFIAFAFPIADAEEFKKKLNDIRKEHPKAVHHCFAYRLGPAGELFRVNDDGEPSGTAGRPILGQIDSKGLTSLGIVVVRYFGGTLLGVPGLINAYKTAAALALQLTPMVKKTVNASLEIEFDYTLLNEIMRLIKQYSCNIIKKDLQLFSRMIISLPIAAVDELSARLGEFRNVEVKRLE
jgi:uncharacterized YigZ family protein